MARAANSKLSYVILDVQDIHRSLLFYKELLHVPVRREESVEGNHLVFLQTGSTEILLLQQPREEQNPHLERSGGLVISFRVENLPGLEATLRENQVEVLREIEQGACERTLLVTDPDGYAVLLTERVETLH